MTKQEIIQKAYGEYWDNLKDSVDENGYANLDNTFSYEDIGLELQDNENWRPKSLKGIESNNGWIKIESKNDLPKEQTSNFVRLNNGQIIQSFYYGQISDYINKVTHYQPIITPREPLY